MALSDEDKKYIKELLTTTTKSIVDNTEELVGKELRAQRLEELKEKKKKGKDTLAERIELEKLILRKKFIDDKFSEETQSNFGQSYRNTKEGLKTAGNVISNSSAGKSALAAIAYTNPLTALLYQNKDLLKGLGSAGALIGKGLGKGIFGTASWLYEKTRKKSDDSSTSLIPSINSKAQNKQISSGATNYIAAKQAIFINGKNYINVMGGGKAAGMFSLPNEKATSTTTSLTTFGRQNLLGNTSKSSNVIEMSKGIDGIYKSTKATSKILSLLNKRVVLISTGILLGVGAIIGLVNWLKGKFGGQVTKAKEREQIKLNNAVKDSSILTFRPEAQAKRLQQQTNSGISGVSETKKTFGDTLATDVETKAFKFNSKEQETKILAPWDGWLYSATIGDYGYTFEGRCKNGKLSGNFVIVGVGEPYIAPGEKFKKGQLLGTANGDSFKIVADMNEQQAIDYQNMVNEAANNSYATQLDDLAKTDKETNVKRMNYYDKLSKSKAKDVELLETADNAINNEESINDQINLPTVTKTPSDNVNTSNNNETIAINNVKSNKNNGNKSTKNITTPNSKNVTIASGKQDTNIIFGVVDKFDIYAAMSDSIDITC